MLVQNQQNNLYLNFKCFNNVYGLSQSNQLSNKKAASKLVQLFGSYKPTDRHTGKHVKFNIFFATRIEQIKNMYGNKKIKKICTNNIRFAYKKELKQNRKPNYFFVHNCLRFL